MKIFITGSSGRIGSAILKNAVSRGHSVLGLVRSTSSAEYITSLGGQPVIGELNDFDLLKRTAGSCDAVIHTARDLAIPPDQSLKLEQDIIEVFGDALAPTTPSTTSQSDRAKVFVMSSSFVGLDLPANGQFFDETYRIPLPEGWRDTYNRSVAESLTLSLTEKGVRPVAVRLPMQTHDTGHNGMHFFIGMLIEYGREKGYVPYLGDGQNPWTCAHSEDVGLAYVLAAERASQLADPQGLVIHPVAEMLPCKDIMDTVAKRIGLGTKPVAVEELRQSGNPRLESILGANFRPSSQWTKETLNWDPKGQGYLEELATADYYPEN